jgi:hypothetical protein
MALGSALHQQGQSKIYLKQQPSVTSGVTTEEVVDTGGVLNVLGEQALNSLYVPAKVSFTIIPGGSANISLITITVLSNSGQACPEVFDLDVNLSDAATGAGLTAVTASGAVAAGTPGTVLATNVSKKSLRVQTDATGAFQLSITDTAKTGFYIHVVGPFPFPSVSRQLLTADYD